MVIEENDGLAKYRKAENDLAPQYVVLLDTYNINKKIQIKLNMHFNIYSIFKKFKFHFFHACKSFEV